jgi:serine phosphatase RsbU (regulator of sigma subunit)
LICQHPDRESIDKALARQTSNRELARVYSLSEASIRRHKANHLPARVARAQEAEDVREALDVVRQLKAINAASLHILKEAREQGKQGTALAAIDRIHKQIELQAKLLGELDDRPQVNVLVSPQWLELRATIVTALERHPQARESVLRAVDGAGSG